jgi:hypothetical protein
MTDQNIDIVKGKILGFLLLSKRPVTITMSGLGTKLQLGPEVLTLALRQLEDDLKVTMTINRAIVDLVDEPETAPNLIDDAEWEKATQATLDAEADEAKAARKGAKNA